MAVRDIFAEVLRLLGVERDICVWQCDTVYLVVSF